MRSSEPKHCFYFDYTSQKEQSPINMLGSLLKQVAGGSREIPEKIVQAFKDRKRFLGGRGLQPSQILELPEITSSLQRTFLCIDALDECVAAHRLKILNSLRQVLQKPPGTRLFLAGGAHIRGEVEKGKKKSPCGSNSGFTHNSKEAGYH